MIDTIGAPATPPGRGGVAVIRVSGPQVPELVPVITGRPLPAARQAVYRCFRDRAGEVIDEGLVLYFPAPGSFTGEHVLELHGHGGQIVVQRLLARLQELGVRLAEPGEFSRRAFLNDRMDLTRAEAIADLIDARSEAAARAAMRSLSGAFAQRVDHLVEGLTDLRTHVESAIDFPDEEIDHLADGAVAARLDGVEAALFDTLAAARGGRALRDGMAVVIAGRPNAGKSSLLNRLAGQESAIVTETPGTTRDALRERILIDGMPLEVTDTAGLRDSDDPIEREGVRRAWQAIRDCDRVLLLVDDRVGIGEAEQGVLDGLPDGVAVTVIRNKVDLTGAEPGTVAHAEPVSMRVSARSGSGLDQLRGHLREVMGVGEGGDEFSARQRHIEALERGARCLASARAQLDAGAGELMAEELGAAQHALGEITGTVTSDDLLGRIFSTFCIGK